MTEIPLEPLNAADKTSFVGALGDLVEYAPWVAETAYARRPFATLHDLYHAMTSAMRGADSEQRLAILKGHPDLAGKAARAGALTADSKAEQASAGLDRLSEEEYARFHRLNDAYRTRFGIPFIVCVRRHTKDSILHQFERRLQNERDVEIDTALAEVFRIVALRLDQRVQAPDRLKVHGRLSTHVLDNHGGHPAAGVRIELFELSDAGASRLIERAITNQDGRTDAPLIAQRPLPIGRYQLRFAIGDYFRNRDVPQGDPAFLDVVPVQFAVAEAEGHYHVPLLVTPWSYATYRGS
jgi:2-oxo-4-hydroxy-4-carboxy-5-ureidoimidazoline decarboxylase